jgi:hypothetical protein
VWFIFDLNLNWYLGQWHFSLLDNLRILDYTNGRGSFLYSCLPPLVSLRLYYICFATIVGIKLSHWLLLFFWQFINLLVIIVMDHSLFFNWTVQKIIGYFRMSETKGAILLIIIIRIGFWGLGNETIFIGIGGCHLYALRSIEITLFPFNAPI